MSAVTVAARTCSAEGEEKLASDDHFSFDGTMIDVFDNDRYNRFVISITSFIIGST